MPRNYLKRTCTRFVNLEVAKKKNNENIPELDDDNDISSGVAEESAEHEYIHDDSVNYHESHTADNSDGNSEYVYEHESVEPVKAHEKSRKLCLRKRLLRLSSA